MLIIKTYEHFAVDLILRRPLDYSGPAIIQQQHKQNCYSMHLISCLGRGMLGNEDVTVHYFLFFSIHCSLVLVACSDFSFLSDIIYSYST